MQEVAALDLIDGDPMRAVFCARTVNAGDDQRQKKTGQAISRPAGSRLSSEYQAASDFL